ncbi:MAG: glycosyltransferase family 4 protein [Candidatus Moraniibacteriota bacterium]|nr:MAG: glycosyltransferase family 4 protein [Candidatus Moranbacteria bacterium]
MKVGIDASRAFLRRRTGIEEYSYQVIRHLRGVVPKEHRVILYVRQELGSEDAAADFDIPENWEIRTVRAPRFCTQIRMGWELLCDGVEVLFVPLHTLLILHPVSTALRFLSGKKKMRTIVVVHGLEYEFFPEAYSVWQRVYMRAAIRFSVRVASQIIAVSENTKRDLVQLYGVPESKIAVIYEGADQSAAGPAGSGEKTEPGTPYFFFIGRIETRKNIGRMIEAFEQFKEKTGLPHVLVLAGKPGHGYSEIEKQIARSKYRKAIQEIGYVSAAEKWHWLRGAEASLFPSLYEGFGLPVIEAQNVGVPVITSNTSSLPEIAGEGALFVDPLKPEQLAEAIATLVWNPEKRADIIEKGTLNVRRFSWGVCAQSVEALLRQR